MINQKIPSVQALRAIAVILVVYTHSIDSAKGLIQDNILKNDCLQINWKYLENWGAIGVDLFFVISGFIMAQVIPNSHNAHQKWQDFALRRLIRITPLYWLMTAIYIFTLLTRHKFLSWQAIAKSATFIPVFEKYLFIMPIIDVGWTLSFEVYFYLIITIIIRSTNYNILYKTSIYLVIFAILGLFTNFKMSLPRFLTNPLLLEFFYGIIISIIYKNIIDSQSNIKKISQLFLIIGVSTMLINIWTGYNNVSEVELVVNNNYIAFVRAIIWGLPCAFFCAGYIFLEKLSSLGEIYKKIMVPITLIGDASFSCYLVHLKCIGLFSKIAPKISVIGPDIYIIACVLFCVSLSLPIYLYIEKPILKIVNQKINKKMKTQTIPTI